MQRSHFCESFSDSSAEVGFRALRHPEGWLKRVRVSCVIRRARRCSPTVSRHPAGYPETPRAPAGTAGLVARRAPWWRMGRRRHGRRRGRTNCGTIEVGSLRWRRQQVPAASMDLPLGMMRRCSLLRMVWAIVLQLPFLFSPFDSPPLCRSAVPRPPVHRQSPLPALGFFVGGRSCPC